MKKSQTMIPLGYAVGTGEPVSIPLAHTFVTGQTQNSGKTTALQAIVARSGRRGLAFVTKRGEGLSGHAVPPYLPQEGKAAIPWRLVETLIASALGTRAMPKERYGIMNAARGETSLAGVAKRAAELMRTSKGETARMYELLVAYLDLVLPEMRELRASPALTLSPGLNVMNLGGVSQQLQAMVMRASLEQIYEHEQDVLTVFPEAWEFAPRDRMTPAKPAAEAIARKGAGLGNFLLCDSQDIAGVSPILRQASSAWLVGVQREANERKRMLDVIKLGMGVVPKANEVATLGVGQFFACHGRTAIKTYVQPSWMSDAEAQDRARRDDTSPAAGPIVISPWRPSSPGERTKPRVAVTDEPDTSPPATTVLTTRPSTDAAAFPVAAAVPAWRGPCLACEAHDTGICDAHARYPKCLTTLGRRGVGEAVDARAFAEASPPLKSTDEPAMPPADEPQPAADAPQNESEDDVSQSETNALLRQVLERLSGSPAAAAPTPAAAAPAAVPPMAAGEDATYERFKARLLAELPRIAAGGPVTITPPEKLRKDFQQAEVARLLAEFRALDSLQKQLLKFLEALAGETLSQRAIALRMGRRTDGGSWAAQTKATKALAAASFVELRDGVGARSILRARVVADLQTYHPTDAEVEAVYQTVLHHLATEKAD